ncbi:MAG: NUDIX domain-containing protein [Lachnospiraceae bacterium]|nr:NUDIX domain-containing protein [Lachnospiraceae bacterium]
MSELLDVFDSKMNHIGIASREDVHKKGYWHQTFHCWIIRQDGDNKYVLFQIRDKEKDVAPNKLDITAAGHLKAGESKEDGLRELKEELGIVVDYKKLHYLGIRITASENLKQINKEFAHVYLLHDDKKIEEYILQEEEVAGLVQVNIKDGLRLCAKEIESVPCKCVRRINGENKISETVLHFNQFIPRIDSYYYKIFIMAERFFQGNTYLSI